MTEVERDNEKKGRIDRAKLVMYINRDLWHRLVSELQVTSTSYTLC